MKVAWQKIRVYEKYQRRCRGDFPRLEKSAKATRNSRRWLTTSSGTKGDCKETRPSSRCHRRRFLRPLKKTSHRCPNSGRDSLGLAEDHSPCPPQRCDSYLEVIRVFALAWSTPHGPKGLGGIKHPAAWFSAAPPLPSHHRLPPLLDEVVGGRPHPGLFQVRLERGLEDLHQRRTHLCHVEMSLVH